MGMWLNFVWQREPETGTELLREIVSKLDQRGLVASFHFFYEPSVEFCIEIVSGKSDEVISIVNDAFRRRNASPPEQREYNDELNFGERGWQIVKKFFEYSSRIALEKNLSDNGRDEVNAFADHKLIHCFLNQQGMTILDEAQFHQERYWERLNRVRQLLPPPHRI